MTHQFSESWTLEIVRRFRGLRPLAQFANVRPRASDGLLELAHYRFEFGAGENARCFSGLPLLT